MRTLFLLALVVAACSTAPEKQSDRDKLSAEVQATIDRFKRRDGTLERWFESAYAYAVFPEIGKGAIGIGGAFGRGLVYQEGEFIGYTAMTQATIGFQFGGQAYSEVVFFQNKSALNNFKDDKLAFSAQVSAVAANAGASRNAKYTAGVAVFTIALGGLMYEASVGGQDFDFEPKS